MNPEDIKRILEAQRERAVRVVEEPVEEPPEAVYRALWMTLQMKSSAGTERARELLQGHADGLTLTWLMKKFGVS